MQLDAIALLDWYTIMNARLLALIQNIELGSQAT